MPGCLYIVATPIGNLEDITLRALRILKEVSLIACEDTRQTQKLLNHYHIQNTLVSYHDFNERGRASGLIEKIQEGQDVALVSDAGMPGISDPGFQIISQAIKANISLTAIPGPSAILNALVLSGLSVHRFAFEGFLPEKKMARKKFLARLEREERTLIFFESGTRLTETLKDILEIMGNRKAAIARELTKKFETLYRGTVQGLIDQSIMLKGEFVIVLSGKTAQEDFEDLPILDHIEQVINKMNLSRKEAIKLVAELRGISKRDVYHKSIKGENAS